MSSMTGKNIKVSVFGQSHSAAIGVVIDGLPAGFPIDLERVYAFMARRAPGQNAMSTTRKEADKPEILSGLADGVTCGAPLCAVIANTNTRSQDYKNLKDCPRPSHADFAASVKYNGFNDVAGGGHFSGRLTAPLCFAGAVCMQILETKNIKVKAHIYAIGGIADTPFEPVKIQDDDIAAKDFPVLDDAQGEKMKDAILAAKADADSVGGVIECAVTGVHAGFGDPMFDGVENILARNIFGVPAIKGIEFGSGFSCAQMRGSEHNDPYRIIDGQVKTETNRSGGITGGITTGMPIVFRVAVKPTASIGKEQKSVSLSRMENEPLIIHGRHDPCIVQRAVPVIEAVTAFSMLDIISEP